MVSVVSVVFWVLTVRGSEVGLHAAGLLRVEYARKRKETKLCQVAFPFLSSRAYNFNLWGFHSFHDFGLSFTRKSRPEPQDCIVSSHFETKLLGNPLIPPFLPSEMKAAGMFLVSARNPSPQNCSWSVHVLGLSPDCRLDWKNSCIFTHAHLTSKGKDGQVVADLLSKPVHLEGSCI